MGRQKAPKADTHYSSVVFVFRTCFEMLYRPSTYGACLGILSERQPPPVVYNQTASPSLPDLKPG
jgi:hypothetical protein